MGKDQSKDKAKDKKIKIRAPEIHSAIPGGSEPIMDRIEKVLVRLEETAEKYPGDQEKFNELARSTIGMELRRIAGNLITK